MGNMVVYARRPRGRPENNFYLVAISKKYETRHQTAVLMCGSVRGAPGNRHPYRDHFLRFSQSKW